MIRFFVQFRAGENGTWQDSLYNDEIGCKTEREAEVLLGKLENIPANEDLEYSVVEREVRWFLRFFCTGRCDWFDSACGGTKGYSTEQEALKLLSDYSKYIVVSREATRKRWFIQEEDYIVDDVWKDSKHNPSGGWECEFEAESFMLKTARFNATNYRLISKEVLYAV